MNTSKIIDFEQDEVKLSVLGPVYPWLNVTIEDSRIQVRIDQSKVEKNDTGIYNNTIVLSDKYSKFESYYPFVIKMEYKRKE